MSLSQISLAAAFVFILPAAVVLAAEQPENASGSVTVNGKVTKLHHAYALRDAEGKVRVMITDRSLDAKALAEENRGELSERVKKGEVTAVELSVEPTNEVTTVEVYNKVFGMPTPFTSHNFWYEPYKLGEGWIGARSRTKQPETFFKTVWEYDVRFLTSIGQKSFDIVAPAALAAQRKANDARETARILPASGGEEGAMYLAYRKNLDARNGKALVDQMTASMKSAIQNEMHASSLSESAMGSWAFMQSVPPGKVEVVGGTRDTDGTTLELRKTPTGGGNKSFGTARVVKEGGAWKIAQETWR